MQNASYKKQQLVKAIQMSAVKGRYYGAGTSPPNPQPRTWQQTPKWHWRYWFGYRMRIGVGFRNGVRPFAYRSHDHHARVVLEAQAVGLPLWHYDPEGARPFTSSRRPKR